MWLLPTNLWTQIRFIEFCYRQIGQICKIFPQTLYALFQCFFCFVCLSTDA
jgi:hypothetical protein